MSKAAIFRSIAHARKSCHRFEPNRTVPPDTMRDVLQTTLRSPSSFNLQPSQIILVQNDTIKRELSAAAMLGAGNQYRVKDCSALAVFLSDLQPSKRIDRIYELEKEFRPAAYLSIMPISVSYLLGEGHLATWMKQAAGRVLSQSVPPRFQQAMPCIESVDTWSAKNTALLVQSYLLAATSHDLATCCMEGFDARRVAEILEIPNDRYSIPMMVATGFEYSTGQQLTATTTALSRRLELKEVVFGDTFGAPLLSLDGDLNTSTIDDDNSTRAVG